MPEDKVEKVRQKWIKEYYRPRFPGISDEKLEEAIVVSKPGSGSCLLIVGNKDTIS